jgi:hypothetical protein
MTKFEFLNNMPQDLNIDADPFLQLLTDALRAGPGSPEWRDAVARLKAGGLADAEQYSALVNARENLESGKPYREIRAGAGFTRKLLTKIQAESPALHSRSPLSASFLSYIGVSLVLGVLAVLIYHIGGSGTEDVSGTLFTTRLSAKLQGPLSPGWRVIGLLPVDPSKGLLAGLNPSSKEYLGGGIVTTSGQSPTDLFAIEATFQFKHVSNDLIPQLFASDIDDFDSGPAISPHELVWLVRGGQGQVVLPNGELAGTPYKITDGSTVNVQMRIGVSQAQVLVDNSVVWTGPSQLAEKPRYTGVRLLRRGDNKADLVTVKNVKLLSK